MVFNLDDSAHDMLALQMAKKEKNWQGEFELKKLKQTSNTAVIIT